MTITEETQLSKHTESVVRESAVRLKEDLASAPVFRAVDASVAAWAGGHAQTLLGHFLPTRDRSAVKRERVDLTTPDGDVLVGFLSKPSERPVGVLHVFHGLAGSSESSYMPRAAAVALSLGYAVVLWNHRGCGRGRGLAVETYHSARSDDLARAVKFGRDLWTDEKIVHGVLGYSLSANAACLLAARMAPALDSNPLTLNKIEKSLRGALPDFAIAVNPPLDLRRASVRLSRGPSRIYGQSFMPALLQNLEDRANWLSKNPQQESFRKLAVEARRQLNLWVDVGTFDAAYTGPAAGFIDHLDYYERTSAGRYLQQTTLPLVILTADDDPISFGLEDLDPAIRSVAEEHPLIILDHQAAGGHMGYVDRSTLFSAWKNQARWLEVRIGLYLNAFRPQTYSQKGL